MLKINRKYGKHRYTHISIFLMSSLFQGEVISCSLLFSVENGVDLIDSRTEIGGISSESDSHNLKELVHAADETLRGVSKTFFTGATFVDNHTIWIKCF